MFDGRVAREYGWTLPIIDGLETNERVRLARIWATESLTREAEQYLARHYQGQAAAVRFAEERKALREMESDEGE